MVRKYHAPGINPPVYNIMHDKTYTLNKVMESSPARVAFRRDLVRPRLKYWNAFLQHLPLGQYDARDGRFLLGPK
jgi:hypothetical protein